MTYYNYPIYALSTGNNFPSTSSITLLKIFNPVNEQFANQFPPILLKTL